LTDADMRCLDAFMPSTGQLLAFVAASLVLILIPGPSVLFTVGRALAYGRRKAMLTAIGNSLGVLAAAVLVAIGLGALIREYAIAYGIVKYAGAAYLVYLGVKALRDRKHLLKVPAAQEIGPGRPALVMFEGFVVGALNPKTILFFLAILPQFLNPDAGSAMVQMLVLGTLFAVLAAGCDTMWAVVAAAARDLLDAPKARLVIGRVGGASLIGLGVTAAAGDRVDVVRP
jgi:threonine/homoserine/homoserine lactone efflux protein